MMSIAMLVTHHTPPKNESKFVNSFLSDPAKTETDKCHIKHILLGAEVIDSAKS